MREKYIVLYDSIVKDYLLSIGLSRRICRKIKLYGKIRINGIEAKNYYPLNKGDELEIELEEPLNDKIPTVNKNINVIYEDENILVVDKQESLAIQPSHKHYEDNLVSYIKYYFLENNINSNVHIITRLDYQTSGLVVIAKNGYTHHILTADKNIIKKYYAIVSGILDNKEGLIDLPIARKNDISIEREVNKEGKNALTKYKVLKEKDNKSLVEIELLTGRTHQIRVHFSHLGHPVIGDKIYGIESNRLYLHCFYLKIINPMTKEILELKSYPNFANEF